MQDGFLFDDGDPKQRGHGCDVLNPKDRRLKFKWQWVRRNRLSGVSRSDTRRLPCQCSEAVLKNGWTLEATFWHTDYEAEVNRHDRSISSYHIRLRDEIPGSILVTRIDAQIKAEELFEELGISILEQIDKATLSSMPLSYIGYKQVQKRLQGVGIKRGK